MPCLFCAFCVFCAFCGPCTSRFMLHGLKRAQGVHHSRALKVTLAPEVSRRFAKDLFDTRRPADKLTVSREQQRRGAADVRRRHAGPIHALRLARGNRAHDLLSRRDEIGLEPPVAGWTTAREITDAIQVSTVAVRRADGDDALGVSGIGDADAAIAFFRTSRGDELEITIVAR